MIVPFSISNPPTVPMGFGCLFLHLAQRQLLMVQE